MQYYGSNETDASLLYDGKDKTDAERHKIQQSNPEGSALRRHLELDSRTDGRLEHATFYVVLGVALWFALHEAGLLGVSTERVAALQALANSASRPAISGERVFRQRVVAGGEPVTARLRALR